MKKKAISLIMGFILLVGILAGCSGGKSASEPTAKPMATGTATAEPAVTGKIVFLNNRIDLIDKLKEIAGKFHAKYPQAEVEIQTVKDYGGVLNVKLTSGDAPDVMYNTTASRNLMPQFFLPLDDMGYNKDNLLFYGTASFDGKVYGLNEGGSMSGVLYNKKTFAKVGISAPPKTLDELYADLNKLKTAGILPMGSMVKQIWPLTNWRTVAFAYANDPDYENKLALTDTPFTADSPYGKQFAFVRTLIDKGYMEKDMASSDWDVLRKEMAADKVGMLMLANYGIGAIEGVAKEDVGFVPLPIDNSGTPVSMVSPGWDIVINKKTKHVEAAKAFIKFWLEESDYHDSIGIPSSFKAKKSNVSQLQEFMSSNPKLYEVNAPSDLLTKVMNKGEITFHGIESEIFLNKNTQEVMDKYNKKWAAARAAVK